MQILDVVEGQAGLVGGIPAGVKTALAVGAERRVDGVVEDVFDVAAPVAGGQIELADIVIAKARTEGGLVVFAFEVQPRLEAFRVHRQPVTALLVIRVAIGVLRMADAVPVGGEAIELNLIGHAAFGVERQVVIIQRGRAGGVFAVGRGFARVVGIPEVHAVIGLAAGVGALLVAPVAAQGEETIPRQGEAFPGLDVFAEAIAFGELAHRRVDFAAAVALLEHDVDDPGNRVRTVLRRRTITQYFDALDGADRDGVEVGGVRTATKKRFVVHEGRNVPALAVDQHQRLVRRQPAQSGSPEARQAIHAVDQRVVERRHQCLQRLAQVGEAGFLNSVGADGVDRRRTLQRGQVSASGPHHHDLIQLRRHLRCRRRQGINHKAALGGLACGQPRAFEQLVQGLLHRQAAAHRTALLARHQCLGRQHVGAGLFRQLVECLLQRLCGQVDALRHGDSVTGLRRGVGDTPEQKTTRQNRST